MCGGREREGEGGWREDGGRGRVRLLAIQILLCVWIYVDGLLETVDRIRLFDNYFNLSSVEFRGLSVCVGGREGEDGGRERVRFLAIQILLCLWIYVDGLLDLVDCLFDNNFHVFFVEFRGLSVCVEGEGEVGWRGMSFLSSASTAGYVYLYSIYYFVLIRLEREQMY
jgi:hypothetical protein